LGEQVGWRAGRLFRGSALQPWGQKTGHAAGGGSGLSSWTGATTPDVGQRMRPAGLTVDKSKGWGLGGLVSSSSWTAWHTPGDRGRPRGSPKTFCETKKNGAHIDARDSEGPGRHRRVLVDGRSAPSGGRGARASYRLPNLLVLHAGLTRFSHPGHGPGIQPRPGRGGTRRFHVLHAGGGSRGPAHGGPKPGAGNPT